jgi:hypothetical protein
MKVGWLIDAGVFDSYHDELAAAVVRNGDIVMSLNRPKPPYGWDDTANSYQNAFAKNSCVVTHADIDLVNRVRRDAIWTPGVIATLEHFYCSHYFSHFGRFLLNRDYVMLPFGELERTADFLFDTFGHEGQIFVRPDSPLKLFTGTLAGRATYARDLEFMAFYEFPMESLVVVSSPKQIETEWRFVIANQSVVAGSRYKSANPLLTSSPIDVNARQLADEILATGYSPDPVWVMDICRTVDGQFHLLEIGCFSFANLYSCDKDAVVHAVSAVAVKMHESHQMT